MPRPLDVEKRKADIARIAFEVLARSGPSGLTIQAVADELGGSVTMVTHIYPSRAELMRGTVEQFVREDPPVPDHADLPSTEAVLRAELNQSMPIDEESRVQERGRVMLIGDKDQDSAKVFADGMEARAHTRLRAVLEGVVDEHQMEDAVDFLRLVINGATLSTVEHPDYWTPERLGRVIDRVVQLFIGEGSARAPSA